MYSEETVIIGLLSIAFCKFLAHSSIQEIYIDLMSLVIASISSRVFTNCMALETDLSTSQLHSSYASIISDVVPVMIFCVCSATIFNQYKAFSNVASPLSAQTKFLLTSCVF